MEEIRIQSLSDTVFERMEQAILTGEFSVGKVLTENGLSKELKVSRTPIREAISRLLQENLVKETQKGLVVSGVSASDIIDIYDVRAKIEGVAAAKCAECISAAALEQLNDIVELQEFYTAKGEADKIKRIDNDFHKTIYDNCGSVIYSEILSLLHKKAQTFRKISFTDNERAKMAAKEHREILSALSIRNGALAAKLAVEHVNNAKSSILKILNATKGE